MAGITSIANIWNNIKEVDLRPIREEAQQVVKLAVISEDAVARAVLASQLRQDPSRSGMETITPLVVSDVANSQPAADADLVILLVDPQAGDFSQEQNLTRILVQGGKKVLVVVNQMTGTEARQAGPWVEWGQNRVVYGPVESTAFLLAEFVPAVIDLLPDQLISLARHFPLFRVAVAHQLINETSFSNAAYSLSTGLAEIVPVFNAPLNVADIVVLTKAQAFLVFRLGLALGYSTQWQDYVSEFGSVLGSGFIWRQIARSLVGLIPAAGIIPKVAVAYAGTYVVGHVVLQWYLTGRHLSRQQIRELYGQAFERGKNLSRTLSGKIKLPRPRLGRRRVKELPAPELVLPDDVDALAELTAGGGSPAEDRTAADAQQCPNCGRLSAADASFCQYCGRSLSPSTS